MVKLSTPPMVAGKSAEELVSVRRYLFRLVEELNMSLNSLTVENFTPAAAKEFGGGSLTEQAKQEISQTQDELKSLIIKNAKFVRQEIDRITHELESNYVAVSDFGTFQQNVQAEITETAEALQRDITATSEIVDHYISTTNGYIRQGIVGYDGLTPLIGIAIGQDITVTGLKETVNGVEYDIIDKSHNMSIWTTQKLSFYVNGNEVAYFANNALTASRMSAGSLEVAGNWAIDGSNGLAFKWIGGGT